MNIRFSPKMTMAFMLVITLSACQQDDNSDQPQPEIVPPPGQAIGEVFFSDEGMNHTFSIEGLTARRTTNGGVSFILNDANNFELIAYFPTMRDTGLFVAGARETYHHLIAGDTKLPTQPSEFTLHITSFDPLSTYPVFSGNLLYTGFETGTTGGMVQLQCSLVDVPVLPVVRAAPGIEVYYNGERLLAEGQILVDEAVDLSVLNTTSVDFCITSPSPLSGQSREVWVNTGSFTPAEYEYRHRNVNTSNQTIDFRVVQFLETPDDLSLPSHDDIEVLAKQLPYSTMPFPLPGKTVWVSNFGTELYDVSDLEVFGSDPPRLLGNYDGNSPFEVYFTGDRINEDFWRGFSKLGFGGAGAALTGRGGFGEFRAKDGGTLADFHAFYSDCASEPVIFIKGRNVPIQP